MKNNAISTLFTVLLITVSSSADSLDVKNRKIASKAKANYELTCKIMNPQSGLALSQKSIKISAAGSQSYSDDLSLSYNLKDGRTFYVDVNVTNLSEQDFQPIYGDFSKVTYSKEGGIIASVMSHINIKKGSSSIVKLVENYDFSSDFSWYKKDEKYLLGNFGQSFVLGEKMDQDSIVSYHCMLVTQKTN